MTGAWLMLGWGLALVVAATFGVRLLNRMRTRERLFDAHSEEALEDATLGDMGFLGRRLSLAGFRWRRGPGIFVGATVAVIVLGAVSAYFTAGAMEQGVEWVSKVPGGIGDLMAPVLRGGPWILFMIVACAPWLYVRAMRRRRVQQVEQDLPIALELLATLGEAGLGFDAALERILQSQSTDRPLAEELRTYQLEALAGVSRVQCFRRLARRLEVTSVTTFISALVQAEQVGAGLADVLRVQADELRNRRRERAMVLAQSLPVKLIFPLVICFLPGIFVTTLGPAFYQFFQIADSVAM